MSRFGGDSRGYGGPGGYDHGGGGGERWDRERFLRERDHGRDRVRGPPVIERDHFEEHDRVDTRGGGQRRRDTSVDDIYYADRRGERFEERDLFASEERYGPPARRPKPVPQHYYEEDVRSLGGSPLRGHFEPPSDRRRRQSITIERDYVPPARQNPPRPGIIRRQSSLDTFDRKPMVRYGDRFREPPETIVIPASGRRRRSPPRYIERDYEEDIRVAEPDYYGDEDWRGFREREVETVRRRRPGNEAIFEEREEEIHVNAEPERPYPRKGKTKMPKRLVNTRAIIELGYPFEEEGETIILLKALSKEQIDEVVRVSKEMKETGADNRTTYLIEAPAPPPKPEVIERKVTEIVISPPPPVEIPRSVREWDVLKDDVKSEKGGAISEHITSLSLKEGGHHRHRGHSPGRSPSRSRSEKRDLSPIAIERRPSRSRRGSRSVKGEFIEEFGESNSMHGPLALIQPKEHRKDERTIKAEIRALEAEKRALRYEREMEKEHRKADRYRDEEIIIERDRDVVKIEKDRKVDPRLIRAAMATLT